jgi:hypothetical protein
VLDGGAAPQALGFPELRQQLLAQVRLWAAGRRAQQRVVIA